MSFVLFCFGVTYRKSLRDERYSVSQNHGVTLVVHSRSETYECTLYPSSSRPKEILPENLGFWASHVLEMLSRSLVISCFSLTLLTLGR